MDRVWYQKVGKTSSDVYYGEEKQPLAVNKPGSYANYEVKSLDFSFLTIDRSYRVVEKRKAHLIVCGLVFAKNFDMSNVVFVLPVNEERAKHPYEILCINGEQTKIVIRKFFYGWKGDIIKYQTCFVGKGDCFKNERYDAKEDRKYAEIIAYGLYYDCYVLPTIE